MSQYNSKSVAIEVTPTKKELIEALLSTRLGDASTWMPSRELQQVRATLAAGTDLDAVRVALASPAFKMARVDSTLMANALRLNRNGASLSKDVRLALDAGLQAVEQATMHAEQRAVGTVAESALIRLGFSLRTAEHSTFSALEARRGHTVLLMAVHPGGSTEVDVAGHAGNDCESVVNEVFAEMASEGVRLSAVRTVRHGSEQGGELIARAAAATANGNLAAGLVSAADAPTPARRPSVRPRQRAVEAG